MAAPTSSSELEAQLEERYGPAATQQILEEIRKVEQSNDEAPLRKSELKELRELVAQFRAQAVQALWRMRNWQNRTCHAAANRKFIEMEGEYLQRQLHAALKLYREIHHHYHQAHFQAQQQFDADRDFSRHAA